MSASAIEERRTSSPAAQYLRQFGHWSGAAAALIGAVVLLGWVAGSDLMRSFLPGHVQTKPNTALALILAGAAQWLSATEHRRGSPMMVRLLVVCVVVISGATLLEYLLVRDFGFDRWLFHESSAAVETPFPGRMSLIAVIECLLFGVTLELRAWRTPRADRWANWTALAGVSGGLMVLLGYTFGAHTLYAIGWHTSIALPTALALTLLFAGALAAHPETGWTAVLVSRGAGGVLLRRLLPFAIMGPWLIGWLSVVGSSAGLFSANVDQVVVVLPVITLFVVLLAVSARALDRLDEEREQRKRDVEALNRELEARVLQRTQELLDANEQLRSNQLYVRSLIESSIDALATVDPQGIITDVNRQMEVLTGCERDHLIGTPFQQYFTDPARAEEGVRLVLEEGRVTDYELVARNREGREIPVAYNASTFFDPQATLRGVFAAARDITERKRAEEALRLNESRLETMLRLNQMTRASLREITDFALEEGIRLTGSQIGYLAFTSEDETELTMHAWSQQAMRQCDIQDKPLLYRVAETGLWGEAVRQRRPVITNDYAASGPLKKGYPPGHVPITRHMNVPVFDGSHIVAVAGVGNKAAEYNESDIRQLTLLMEGMWRIVQRQRAEADLQRQATLLHLAPAAIIVRDRQGRVSFWSRGAEELYGWSAEEVLGKVTHDLLQTRFPEPSERIEAELVSGRDWEGELQHTTRGGRRITVGSRWATQRDAQGGAAGFLEINVDITDRKRAESELRRVNRALKALSRCSDAVARATDEIALLQRVCDLIVQIGGYPLAWVGYAEQDEPKTVTPVAVGGFGAAYVRAAHITWADTERGRGPTGIAIRTGQPCCIGDIIADPRFTPWREAALHHGYASVMAVPLKEGERSFGALNLYAPEPNAFDREEQELVLELAATLSYGILALRARQERDQAAADLQHLNLTLERRVAERTAELAASNAEMEAFTYSVSHDLRAPLRHIDGFSKVLLDQCSDRLDDMGRHYLDRIRHATQNMGRLVDDLLNLSHIGRRPLHVEEAPLGEIVREIAGELQADAGARSIEWRIAPLPVVDCDPNLIRQVFINLLSNAVKFTRDRAPAVIEVGVEGDELFVRDNGVGFDPKYADKLFGVFQRLHRSDEFEGTGVGLATVRRILRKHGGDIHGESVLGKGATFRFTLGRPEADSGARDPEAIHAAS